MKKFKEFLTESELLESKYNDLLAKNVGDIGGPYLNDIGSPIAGSIRLGPDSYLLPNRRLGGSWYTLVNVTRKGNIEADISSGQIQFLAKKV